MRRIILFLFIFSLYCFAQMPCDAPPTNVLAVKPNLLVILDISGSMRWRAYWFSGDSARSSYNPNKRYYGYYHPDSIYQYSSNKFRPVGYCNGNYDMNTTNFDVTNDKYLGNILNWGTMSRIDIAKKVLAGGYGEPTNEIDKHTLIGQGDGSGWPTPTFTVGNTKYRIYKPGYMSSYPERFYIYKKSGYSWSIVKTYSNRIDVSNMDINLKCGVIRQIADKDFDGNWDASEEIPRFAFMTFSTGLNILREFYQTDETPSMEPFLNAINNITPGGATAVGNAILEGIHYIRYCSPHFGAYTGHNWKTKWDPFYRSTGGQNVYPVWCMKNFVLIIGDGESNSDRRVQSDPSHLPSGPWSNPICGYNNNLGVLKESWDIDNYDCTDGSGDTDHPADDYAYYGHITDLRPDNSLGNDRLAGFQNITFYSIFAFGRGANLFKSIAKWGGFIDKNKDKIPQVNEYDADSNGVPDNYYEAEEGSQLEEAIKKILYEIMAQVSSGTATAIVATGTRGEGVGTYALYYPRKYFGENAVDWIGMLQGVWVDPYGNLREETEGNLQMHLKNDFVIQMEYDTASGETKISRYRDKNGKGDTLEFVDQVTYDNLNTIFDLGKYLLNVNPNDRNIFTFINNNKVDFKIANRNTLKQYLDVASDNMADSLINYIRGTDYPNYRSRTVPNQGVYKLGDIIFSSPLVVGPPMERYDLLYGDTSYMSYFKKYNIDDKRRSVVYAGANDGMLHCANIGLYYTDSGVVAGHLDPSGHTPGKELWAYIPFNLLPHLKWLKEESYCHVYYVDLKPYPTDVKIFQNDQTHTNGWGTILIVGFRMGGTKYILPSGTTLSSGYACIDVTDPLNPNVLWEWKIPENTYSTCYPNVIKVQDKWYMIVGTGPTQFNGFSNINGKIYVLDLQDGSVKKTFTLQEPYSSIGDIISVDFDLDYNVDLIYFGTYYCTDNTGYAERFRGNLYRINTRESSDPNNWALTKLFGPTRCITEPPAATLDEEGKLWIYFGTGKYFSNEDEADTTIEYFYGIKDEDTTSTVSLSGLVDISNVNVYGDSVTGVPNVNTFSELEGLISTKKGWYRRLKNKGEKSTARPYILGGTLIFTSFQPTGDICASGGLGRLYALYYKTGTAYKKPILPKNPLTGEHEYISELGPGLPAEPSLYVGPTDEKIFVQISGTVQQIQNIDLVTDPRGGLIMWKRR